MKVHAIAKYGRLTRAELFRSGRMTRNWVKATEHIQRVEKMKRNRVMARKVICSESWKDAAWKRYTKSIFRLQRRIFKAVLSGNLRKARKLQNLLLRSKAAKWLAVRRVTQLNKGKNTAGVDGKKVLTPVGRIRLVRELMMGWDNWEHQKLKALQIPKSNGKMRTLKIPTIADRAWQALLKFAIEPAHEATFHARSYGFRPGRGTHDAQQYVFLNLRGNPRREDSPATKKIVLELDIAKCFDTISHKAIMDRVIAPRCVKKGLWKCLRAGSIDAKFPDKSEETSKEGTPQGGVISPLLANIALNGIEEIGPCVRYADDMVFFVDEEAHPTANALLRRIEAFLEDRGMKVSREKTKITKPTEGFDFLGWNFRVQATNGKCKSSPSKKNREKFVEKMDGLRLGKHLSARVLVDKAASITRGWQNYHKYTDGKDVGRTMWYVNHALFKRFKKGKKTSYSKAVQMAKKACPAVETKTNGFIMVAGEKSPYDGDIQYWCLRNNTNYEGLKAEIIRKQRYLCKECGLRLLGSHEDGEDNAEIHHVDGNHFNNKKANLAALHRSCHMKLKSKST